MIDFENCVKLGLLRKIPASKEKARQSIEKAKVMLIEAKANLKDERIYSAVIVAYLALFHTARSLLFKDGYREKSHECIVRYLEEKYAKTKLLPGDAIEMLDKFKSDRTHTQYDVGHSPTEEDAEKMIEFAEEFIELVEQLIG